MRTRPPTTREIPSYSSFSRECTILPNGLDCADASPDRPREGRDNEMRVTAKIPHFATGIALLLGCCVAGIPALGQRKSSETIDAEPLAQALSSEETSE